MKPPVLSFPSSILCLFLGPICDFLYAEGRAWDNLERNHTPPSLPVPRSAKSEQQAMRLALRSEGCTPFQLCHFFSSVNHKSSQKVPGEKNKTCFNSKMLGSALAIFQRIFNLSEHSGLDNCLGHNKNCSEAPVLISEQKSKENGCMRGCSLGTNWLDWVGIFTFSGYLGGGVLEKCPHGDFPISLGMNEKFLLQEWRVLLSSPEAELCS